VPDIGLGEVVVIAVLALLIFGPDRLPKVAADAGKMLRQVRELATNARKDLIDAAGMDEAGDLRAASAQLDPRRALRDESAPPKPGGPGADAPGAPSAGTPSGVEPSVQDWT
jgi:sec-independent protein translocase protein TatB